MGYNVAIDGPAGAGKSTIAKLVAKEKGFIYVDTGAMYRGLAIHFIDKGIAAEDTEQIILACNDADVTIRYENGLQQVYLNDVNITSRLRDEAVGSMASKSSAIPEVRAKLLELQRGLARTQDVIMDGRDIGTCVLPDADVKVFLTASVETRAMRRYKELVEKGVSCDFDEIARDIEERDHRDMTSLPDDHKEYHKLLDNSVKGRKLFYFKEALENKDNDPEVAKIIDNFYQVLEKCHSLGIEVCEESMPIDLFRAVYPAYKSISCAEVTSNDANLTGIHFGVRGEGNTPNEIIMDARTKGFSELIKRRFILGSYILQKENQEKLFLNACRVRRMVVDLVNNLFSKYDGLIMPAAEMTAPKLDYEPNILSDKYLILGNHLVIGNFGGYPSITIPSGFVNNLPIGINITGHIKEDDVVLNLAYQLEQTMNYANQIAKEENHV